MTHGFGFDDPTMQKYWRLHILAPELEPTFRSFVEKVYRPVLAERIDRSTQKGMSGRFGNVTLRSFSMCGRVMLTFECDGEQVTYLGADIGNERYDDKNRPLGETFGLHSVDGSVFAARSMIDTVIALWSKHSGAFRDDDPTTLDVIAAMRSSA